MNPNFQVQEKIFYTTLVWHHDTQNNDIRLNDTKHKNIIRPSVLMILSIQYYYAECSIFIVMLNVCMMSVVKLSVIMLSVVMVSVIMMSVVILSVIILSVVMLSVIMLSVVMLNIIMMSCCYAECHYAKCSYTECWGVAGSSQNKMVQLASLHRSVL